MKKAPTDVNVRMGLMEMAGPSVKVRAESLYGRTGSCHHFVFTLRWEIMLIKVYTHVTVWKC